MIVIGYDLVSYLLHYPSARCDYTGKQGQASCFLGKSPALRVVFSRKTLHSLIPTFLGTRNENDRCDRMLQEIAGKVWKKEDELKQLKSELAALDRKIQLELAPPTPETSEKENEGQNPYNRIGHHRYAVLCRQVRKLCRALFPTTSSSPVREYAPMTGTAQKG